MAEVHRMTVDEVVSYFLEGEGVDVLRDSLRWVCQQLMEAEVSELIGAEHGERSPERLTHRNGYGSRPWQTRAGEVELAIPKVAELLEEAEEDLLAFYALPAEHWPKLRSTNPLERVNREIGRRTDVVGIFPRDKALLRLAVSLVIEQNDEWLVGRRYLSLDSLASLLEERRDNEHQDQEVLALNAA